MAEDASREEREHYPWSQSKGKAGERAAQHKEQPPSLPVPHAALISLVG